MKSFAEIISGVGFVFEEDADAPIVTYRVITDHHTFEMTKLSENKWTLIGQLPFWLQDLEPQIAACLNAYEFQD